MAQIFNHSAFLDAYARYMYDSSALDDLLSLLTPLAEVIASSFSNDSEYREDLIQECMARAIKALPSYDPSVAKPHSYFTSVFRNICITYITKQTKQPLVDLAVLNMERCYDTASKSSSVILEELLIRNRERFPSVDVGTLDGLTVHIYKHINSGSRPGSSNGIIKSAMSEFHAERRTITIIFHSTLVWLRAHYINYSYYDCKIPGEMTVLYDVYEIFGEDVYEYMSTVFAGLSIKLPK